MTKVLALGRVFIVERVVVFQVDIDVSEFSDRIDAIFSRFFSYLKYLSLLTSTLPIAA